MNITVNITGKGDVQDIQDSLLCLIELFNNLPKGLGTQCYSTDNINVTVTEVVDDDVVTDDEENR